jgi:hypothetical protein
MLQVFVFCIIILITLSFIPVGFLNQIIYTSKDNSTDNEIFVLPFNSHIADQAKDKDIPSSDVLPFP